MWGHTEQTGHPVLREKILRDALLSHILTIIDTCIHTSIIISIIQCYINVKLC